MLDRAAGNVTSGILWGQAQLSRGAVRRLCIHYTFRMREQKAPRAYKAESLSCTVPVPNSCCQTIKMIKPQKRVKTKNLALEFLLPSEQSSRNKSRLNVRGARWGNISDATANFKHFNKGVWMTADEWELFYLTLFTKPTLLLDVVTQIQRMLLSVCLDA